MIRRKATDEQLLDVYSKTNNIWETAKCFGMCGQSVHERLVKLNKINKKNYLKEKDKEKIRNLYIKGFSAGDNKLDTLCKEIKRTKSFVCRFAKKEGLTNSKRKKSDILREEFCKRAKRYIEEKGHPKGMLGKHHTEKIRKLLTKKSTEMWDKMTKEKRRALTDKQITAKIKKYGTSFISKRTKCSWKSGTREIADRKIFFRSRWEANYARYLEYLKQHKKIKEWEHENKIFWFKDFKDNCKAYLPDFEVFLNNGKTEYHEVKGWYDKRSKTKIRKTRKEYPSISLKLIKEKQYKKIKENYANKILDWEY